MLVLLHEELATVHVVARGDQDLLDVPAKLGRWLPYEEGGDQDLLDVPRRLAHSYVLTYINAPCRLARLLERTDLRHARVRHQSVAQALAALRRLQRERE